MWERYGVGRCCCLPEEQEISTCLVDRDLFEGAHNDPIDTTIWEAGSNWVLNGFRTLSGGDFYSARGSSTVRMKAEQNRGEKCQHVRMRIVPQLFSHASYFCGATLDNGAVTAKVYFKIHNATSNEVRLVLTTDSGAVSGLEFATISSSSNPYFDLCLTYDCVTETVKAYVQSSVAFSLEGGSVLGVELKHTWTGGLQVEMTANSSELWVPWFIFDRSLSAVDPVCPSCGRTCACDCCSEHLDLPPFLLLESEGWRHTVTGDYIWDDCNARGTGFEPGDCDDRNHLEWCLACASESTNDTYNVCGDITDPSVTNRKCVWDWPRTGSYFAEPCNIQGYPKGWRVYLFQNNPVCPGHENEALRYWNHTKAPLQNGHWYIFVTRWFSRQGQLAVGGCMGWFKDLGVTPPDVTTWSRFELTDFVGCVYDDGTEVCFDQQCWEPCAGYGPHAPTPSWLYEIKVYLSYEGCEFIDRSWTGPA